jgi:hypothetical protein
MDTIEIGQLNILDIESVREYSNLIMEVMNEFNENTPTASSQAALTAGYLPTEGWLRSRRKSSTDFSPCGVYVLPRH